MNQFNFRLWRAGALVAFFVAFADALGVYVAAESVIWGKVIAFAVIKGLGGAGLYMKTHPIEPPGIEPPRTPRAPRNTVIGIILCLCLLGCGCVRFVPQNKQTLEKTTVFGFQGKTPQIGGLGPIVIQFGLVRNTYWTNPTGTNEMFAAPFNSAVQADMTALHQRGAEAFGTYELPDAAFLVMTNQ